MKIAFNDDEIEEFIGIINRIAQDHPILVDKYLQGKEIEVDAVCDGTDILIPVSYTHLLFSFGYIMEGKNDHRYEFMTVQPYSEWKKYRHYVTSFFVAAGVVCAIGIGVWFLYWGMRCGFDGIDSHMFVDVKTYKRFYSYEHLEDYSYEGLSLIHI